MGKTVEHLMEAFAGESQANRKYLAYASKADQEGHRQAAKLFRAAAEAETVHAHAHLRAMGGIGSTEDNLHDAIAGETHEFTKMYPEMIETAAAEGHKEAERSFRFANAVEATHAKLYEGVLNAMGTDAETYPYYVCPVCGHTVAREAPATCPVCGTAGAKFMRID
jgi:rubrerythrin